MVCDHLDDLKLKWLKHVVFILKLMLSYLPVHLTLAQPPINLTLLQKLFPTTREYTTIAACIVRPATPHGQQSCLLTQLVNSFFVGNETGCLFKSPVTPHLHSGFIDHQLVLCLWFPLKISPWIILLRIYQHRCLH